MAAPASKVTHRTQPRAVVPSPTYLSPDAKITNVMAGRMYLSGALDEIYEPTITAGMLPMMIDVVTKNSTCPNARAPSAAAAVNGTAWGEVSAHQLIGTNHGIEKEEHYDHQGARPDRGHPDNQATDHADRNGGDGDDQQFRELTPSARGLPGGQGSIGSPWPLPQPKVRRPMLSRCSSATSGCFPGDGGGRRRGRPSAPIRPPSNRPRLKINSFLRHVNSRPKWPHEDGSDKIAGDGRRGLDIEQQDQHWRHQCPTTRSRQPDEEPNETAPEDDVRIDSHECPQQLIGAEPQSKGLPRVDRQRVLNVWSA